MGFYLGKLIAALVMPPGVIVVFGVAGLACLRWFRRLGWLLIAAALLALYALSTPAVARVLAHAVEEYPPWPAPVDLNAAGVAGLGAIVVLGGGRRTNAYEYGGQTVSSSSLVRVRYGAHLHRKTKLPLLVTGGHVFQSGPPEAELMRRVAEDDFGVVVKWLEKRSRNTAENAQFSARLLEEAGIGRIVLVTHARHMARAVEAFEAAGMDVQPAPVAFASSATDGWWLRDWLPDAGALETTEGALHEWVGRVWYAMRRDGSS